MEDEKSQSEKPPRKNKIQWDTNYHHPKEFYKGYMAWEIHHLMESKFWNRKVGNCIQIFTTNQ